MGNENPHKGHRERMRKRFAKSGFEEFAEHEILEYMLFYVFKQGDTNALAHRIIEKCGSFANVFSAKSQLLCEVDGVGPQCASYIEAIGEFMREYGRRTSSVKYFDIKDAECVQYLIDLFADIKIEQLYMIALDSKGKIMGHKKLCDGSFAEVEADIGDIARKAWELNAPKVILAHNHPSGVVTPSDKDINTNHIVCGALKMMKIVMVEHYVVTRNGCKGIFEFEEERDKNKNAKYSH